MSKYWEKELLYSYVNNTDNNNIMGYILWI